MSIEANIEKDIDIFERKIKVFKNHKNYLNDRAFAIVNFALKFRRKLSCMHLPFPPSNITEIHIRHNFLFKLRIVLLFRISW